LKGKVWPGEYNFPDFHPPKVREWWAELIRNDDRNWCACRWNDMNEPARYGVATKEPHLWILAMKLMTGIPVRHRKSPQCSYGEWDGGRATYEGIKEIRLPRKRTHLYYQGGICWNPKVFPLHGPAIMWPHGKIYGLAMTGPKMCIGADIRSSVRILVDLPNSRNGELFASWFNWGYLHPFCRVHSSGDHGDQEPWYLTMK